MPTDAGALFGQGFANGVNAVRVRDARKEAEKRQALEERQQTERELDGEVDRKRRNELSQQWEFEMAAKKADAARLLESETAFNKFGEVIQSIDWSSPDSLKQYGQAVNLHIPTIAKHESTLKKWEAVHRATMDNASFTQAKMADIQLVDLQKQLAQRDLGPTGMAIAADVKAGKLTQSEAIARAQELIDQRDEKEFKQAKQLRGMTRSASAVPKPSMQEQVELKDLDTMIEADLKTYQSLAPGGKPKTDEKSQDQILAVTSRIAKNRERRKQLAAGIDKRVSGADESEPESTSSPAPEPEKKSVRMGGQIYSGEITQSGPQAPRPPAPPGRRPGTVAAGEVVMMWNPKGQRVAVPQDQVETAKAKGYK